MPDFGGGAGNIQAEILSDLAGLACRPYDFVLWAYPWGEAGTELESRSGPEAWQTEVLLDLQNEMLSGRDPNVALAEAYQVAIKSGHDIGKTAFLCWVIQWALSTREDTRGRATANTEKQLSRILWSELAKWHRLFIARDFFKHTATAYHSTDPEREKTWRIDAIPWSEDNPEAFAGLHNYGKRVLVIFDEASGIHDKIWEVVGGVMAEANTELLWLTPGNPTKNTGRFRECWNRFASQWRTYTVDSRTVSFTNKAKIQKDIDAWGIESDYVKTRWLGEFPDAASTQLIPVETIRFARKRPAVSFPQEPLIMSLDVARFGSNESVLGFRRGKDARSIPVERWRGLSVVETATRAAARIVQHQPDGVFIDEGGVGGGVVDLVRSLGHFVIGVNFGSSASSRPGGVLVANKRAEMYVSFREWLREGGAIEDSDDLEEQLVAIEYFFNKKSEIQLVAKEDMEAEGFPSPDWADQIVMTFAYPVAARRFRGAPAMKVEYDPLSQSALPANDSDPYSLLGAVADPYRGW